LKNTLTLRTLFYLLFYNVFI